MTKAISFAGLLLITMYSATAQTKLINAKDSVSYAIGLDLAKNFNANHLDSLVNADILFYGLKDGLIKTNKFLISPDSTEQFITSYIHKIQSKQQVANLKKYESNIEKGKNFLAENKKKSGVISLPSGLQYKILKKGSGAIPKSTDMVTVNYKGTFIDGRVFDSSYDRNEPATFPVSGGIIKGWTEALQIMPVGSKWIVYIPQELAYGANEDGRIPIEPYSLLIFEIELLKISNENAH